MYDSFYDVVLPQPEVWKDVYGFEGYYEVSSYGGVRSLDRITTFVRKGHLNSRLFKGKVLKPKYDKDGYESYTLRADGENGYKRGHRLVAEAFIPNTHILPVVDHKDANVQHNCFWNLQWMTPEQNTIKHYAQETDKVKSLSSLSYYEWRYIGYLYNEGLSYEAICGNMGIDVKSPTTLWEGLTGRRLSSVSGFKKGDFRKRKHPKTKLDIDTVVDIIKARLIDKQPLKVISAKYGIAESMVSRFCSGKRQPEALIKFKEQQRFK